MDTNTTIDKLIFVLGEHHFIDAVFSKLDKQQAQELLTQIAEEHGLSLDA